ncbi:MAG TPA: hypothetical protein VGO62_13945, partial [Myxococcota bacterium]
MKPSAALLLALIAAASSGCLVGEVSGIPCDGDSTCPSSYFCDLPRSECLEKSDTQGAPALDITKLLVDGAAQLIPKIPNSATTPLGMVVENAGGGPAEGIQIDFAYLECVSFEVHEDTVPPTLDKKQSATITVDVT